MANISTYAAKALLDFWGGGASPTAPTTRAVGLSLGTPTSVSASEMATGEGVTRQLVTYVAAASPAGSASNSNAITFGPFSSNRTVIGLQAFDDGRSGSGNMWWYGTLATARNCNVGDYLIFNAGALVHTLS
jgi:hypothetical protein